MIPTVAPLATGGNRIVRADTNEPVLLRGVNRSGLEYTEPAAAGFLAAAGFTEDEARHIVEEWGANVVRVPFNQDWALNGRRGHSAGEYIAALDQAIAWLAVRGAYTILDLQWLSADIAFGTTRGRDGDPEPNRVAPTPNADTITLWRKLATHFRDNPAVLIDLFNEPHDRLPDDPYPLHVVGRDGTVAESRRRRVDADVWTAWADRLISEIRSAGFGGLILAGGVDWAFDLSQIELDWEGVVYSTHIYSNRDRSRWELALGQAADVPVFVGEWGGRDSAEDLAFGRDLAERMRGTVAGWTAWSWADYPRLIQPPPAAEYTPTAFGELVRAELRRET
jgi:hypothetical protein